MTSRHLDCDRCSQPHATLRIVSVDGEELAVFCDRCLQRLLAVLDELLPAGKGSPRFHAWRQRRQLQRSKAKQRSEMQSAEASELFQRLLLKDEIARLPSRRRR